MMGRLVLVRRNPVLLSILLYSSRYLASWSSYLYAADANGTRRDTRRGLARTEGSGTGVMSAVFLLLDLYLCIGRERL